MPWPAEPEPFFFPADSLEMTEVKADAERFETVYARENLTSVPEGFDPDIHDPEQLQDKPDPEPTGRILFLL